MGVVLLREFLFDSFAIKKDVFYEKTSLLILHRAQNLPSLLLLSKVFLLLFRCFASEMLGFRSQRVICFITESM